MRGGARQIERVTYCPGCGRGNLDWYDDNGDMPPESDGYRWCRRCQGWVIPKWRTHYQQRKVYAVQNN